MGENIKRSLKETNDVLTGSFWSGTMINSTRFNESSAYIKFGILLDQLTT
jgi:hypothetical protein